MRLDERFPILPYDPDIAHEPLEWWVESVWLRGKINAVLGAEKSGKSRLMAWLLAASFTGADARIGLEITQATAPHRLLYLAGEETRATVIDRFRDYVKWFGGDPGRVLPIDFIEASGMRLDLPDQRRWLEQKIREEEYDALFLEPLRRVHGGDEDSNTEMAPLHNDLRRWSNSLGTTVVICHHTGKLREDADYNRIATWSRGNTDLVTLVDAAVFVQETSRKRGERTVKLLRAGRFPPYDALMLEDRGDPTHGGTGWRLKV